MRPPDTFTLSFIAAGVLLGLWFGWRRLRQRPVSFRGSLVHGLFSWIGVVLFLIYLSRVPRRFTGGLHDLTAGLFVLAGLIGVLVGFVRLAGQSVVSELIIIHVLVAAGGLGLLIFLLV